MAQEQLTATLAGALAAPATTSKEGTVAVDLPGLAIGRLNEAFDEVHRHATALDALDAAIPGKPRTLDEIQRETVRETKRFFDAVYSLLGHVIAAADSLAKELRDTEFLTGLRTNSVKRWLEVIATRVPAIAAEAKVLEEARAFRARFAHPQSPGHLVDWMTMGFMDETGRHRLVPIWFVPDNDAPVPVFAEAPAMPFDEGFVPPVQCSKFALPPRRDLVLAAARRFADSILERFDVRRELLGDTDG